MGQSGPWEMPGPFDGTQGRGTEGRRHGGSKGAGGEGRRMPKGEYRMGTGGTVVLLLVLLLLIQFLILILIFLVPGSGPGGTETGSG